MERHKPVRNPYLLVLGASGYVLLAAFVNMYPPDTIVYIVLFLIAFTVSTGFILQYVFRKIQTSVLWSGGLALLLILRLFGLKSPIYTVLLLASIISFEILWKRK